MIGGNKKAARLMARADRQEAKGNTERAAQLATKAAGQNSVGRQLLGGALAARTDRAIPKVTNPTPYPSSPAVQGLGSIAKPMPGGMQGLGGMGGAAMRGLKSMASGMAGGPRPMVGSPRPGGAMFKKGGSVGSASKRADGIAVKGKTRGKIV